MKTRSLTCTLTAVLLTLVATVAHSQTGPLTANVPFAFRAVGSDLPAGKYVVAAAATAGAGRTMELRSLDTGKVVFLAGKPPSNETKDSRPRLVFQCVDEEGCALISLWSGAGGAGLEFSNPPLTASQRERRETIYFDRLKGK